MVNSAIECASEDDEECYQIVQDYAHDLEALLKEAFIQAQAKQELDLAKDPEELARFFGTVIYGIRVRARLNPTEEELRAVANIAMKTLD